MKEIAIFCTIFFLAGCVAKKELTVLQGKYEKLEEEVKVYKEKEKDKLRECQVNRLGLQEKMNNYLTKERDCWKGVEGVRSARDSCVKSAEALEVRIEKLVQDTVRLFNRTVQLQGEVVNLMLENKATAAARDSLAEKTRALEETNKALLERVEGSTEEKAETGEKSKAGKK